MEAINRAISLCEDYKEAHHNIPNPRMSRLYWKPPNLGHWKLNVDGSIFHDHHRIGIGLFLWDDQGSVNFSTTVLETYLSNLLEVEFMSILLGMQLCASWVSQQL